MKKIKLGLLACGGIAHKMARAAAAADNVELYACAARDLTRAKDFAAIYNIPVAYGSYERLAADAAVDLIYVSSLNHSHFEHVKLCLEAGKHVICEKPFTTSAAQAKELFALAASKKLFLMEAMWTRFLPAIRKLKEMIDAGELGELIALNLTSGQAVGHVPRLARADFAGGALLDMGVYSLTYSDLYMGEDIKNIYSSARLSDEGVDQTNMILLDYGDGKAATVMSSSLAAYEHRVTILGTKAYAVINGVYGADSFSITRGSETITYNLPSKLRGNGFEHELIEAADCIIAGKIESDIHPGAKTIYMMGLLDRIRARWGMVYPFEVR